MTDQRMLLQQIQTIRQNVKDKQHMEIIEKKITGKTSQEKCEDGIIVTDNYIAVIDGSTSKSKTSLYKNESNGQFAMNLIKEFIAKAPSNFTCYEFCTQLTSFISNQYKELEIDIQTLSEHPEQRATASAIIYNHTRHEIWMVGDCQCLIGTTLFENPKPYEEPIASMRSAYIRLALLEGKTIEDFIEKDTGRTFVLPFMLNSMKYQNIRYAVIDGFPIPQQFVRIIPVPSSSKFSIVLASDGYPFLKPTLEESEKALSSQLKNDPLCIDTFHATKGLKKGNVSFDDRSYIKFLI